MDEWTVILSEAYFSGVEGSAVVFRTLEKGTASQAAAKPLN
jgi:hypothetical protein